MKILEVFSSVKSLLNKDDQRISECLIELATFFYKIDRRVSLAEQDYIDDLMKSIKWESTIHIVSYQADCVARVNTIFDSTEDQVCEYLSRLMEELLELGGDKQAKVIAKEISDADGEIADEESKYLDYVMAFE